MLWKKTAISFEDSRQLDASRRGAEKRSSPSCRPDATGCLEVPSGAQAFDVEGEAIYRDEGLSFVEYGT